jgi:hypothetical protein
MWERITDIVKNATAFLYAGKIPPNTPIQYREDFSKINFFSSKKFFIVFSSVILLMVFYLVSVGILFLTSFFPEITQPYVTIFVESIKIFAIIISVYLGLQATIDFKYQSNSSTTNDSYSSLEKIDQKIITEETIKYQNIYKNDPSYAPLEWVFNQEETK